MRKFLIGYTVFFSVFTFRANATQAPNKATDTSTIISRITERMRNFKQQNKVQIYRYESSDSTIIFGCNKRRNLLTSVMILDKAHNENRWFYFDSVEVFRITIADRRSSQTGNKKKKSTTSYYFENSKVIYKVESDKRYNTIDLINEAKKYQELAAVYLKTY